MESLYNFQWDIPAEAESSFKTISYSLHGETSKYVIENAVEFLTDKFGFFVKACRNIVQMIWFSRQKQKHLILQKTNCLA